MNALEAVAKVHELQVQMPADGFARKKLAFVKALGAEYDYTISSRDYALRAMNEGRKTPDEVVAIAMLVFQ